MESYSSLLNDPEKYPDGSIIREFVKIVERHEYHGGKFKAMITLINYNNGFNLNNSQISNFINGLFESKSHYCAYLSYPENHAINNWSEEKWDDFEEAIDNEITYGETNLIGVDFSHLRDYNEQGEIVRDIARVRDCLEKMVNYLNNS